MSVDVILPCLDEAGALPWVLGRIPEGYRAIVVDNGSTDGSPTIASGLGALVVHAPQRGFGAAVHAGMLAATADTVAIVDCDASLDPADLPRLVAALHAGSDLVLGRRRPVGRSAWPLHARLANRVLAARINRATGLHLHDLGPMRVLHREPVLALDLQDRRSGYPLEMVLAATAAGWRIDEHDVDYTPRIGRSKVTGTVRGTLTAVHDMRRMLNNNPAKRAIAPPATNPSS
jgi:glycosyltransferase involved in cell wall biosynthesis